jgi:hypothetical protein
LSSRPQPPVAAGAAPGEDGSTAYALLRNSWIVRRAGIESTILTYFPKVDSCWYSYELAISDFISLSADNNALNRKTRVSDIRRYLESNFARSYVAPHKTDPACARVQELPLMIRARLRKDKRTLEASKNGRSNWDQLTLPTTDPHFSRGAYAVLGEALLFGDERSSAPSVPRTPKTSPTDGSSNLPLPLLGKTARSPSTVFAAGSEPFHEPSACLWH